MNGVDMESVVTRRPVVDVEVGDDGVPTEWYSVARASRSFTGSLRESRPGVCGRVADFRSTSVVSSPIFILILTSSSS